MRISSKELSEIQNLCGNQICFQELLSDLSTEDSFRCILLTAIKTKKKILNSK